MADVREISPWTWQDNFGYAQSIEVKNAERTLYCAGQTSVDTDGNVVNEGDLGAQMLLALDNLEAVLSKAGLALKDVVRLNFYTTDIDGFLASMGPGAERLAAAGCKPASTLLGVSQLAFPGLMVEIEATAVA